MTVRQHDAALLARRLEELEAIHWQEHDARQAVLALLGADLPPKEQADVLRARRRTTPTWNG